VEGCREGGHLARLLAACPRQQSKRYAEHEDSKASSQAAWAGDGDGKTAGKGGAVTTRVAYRYVISSNRGIGQIEFAGDRGSGIPGGARGIYHRRKVHPAAHPRRPSSS